MKFAAQDSPRHRRDQYFMRRALALARRGLGKTSPNPCVGAVLVLARPKVVGGRGDRIIGEGWHKKAGGPHAEIEALRAAGIVPGRGGDAASIIGIKRITNHQSPITTLYVTLEPCCTHGRTQPCTDAIIAAGVKRVVVGAVDPNPRHRGRGLKLLRRAGIRVTSGVLAEEAMRLNEAFNKWITMGMPLVIAKAAMSLDGKIATRTGDSKWITSDAARRYAHELRAQVDAIMVGANTVIRDDPRLTTRLRGGRCTKQPWRVIVDARGRCPKNVKLFTDAKRSHTIVITSNRSPAHWRRYLPLEGITVITLPWKKGGVDLRAALRALGRMNITSVLVEGGGELLGAMFDAQLVDRVAFFCAPMVIGGRTAVPSVGGEGAAQVRQAVRLRDCRWSRVPGTDEMLLEAAVTR
jgi:diaminohydroxyphosphoribosylaminopyrimidine deaminase/5-amino-6-(5-phosphoribosylamino)uracil reductase